MIDKKENNFLENFKKNNEVVNTLDTYKGQVEELFLIKNPHYRFTGGHTEGFNKFWVDHLGTEKPEKKGNWFYFPWNKLLVHYLEEDWYYELRTARNRNLITKEEQSKFYNFRVGVAGLSVGSHPALTMTMMGGAKNIKLADPDTISCSNLNRIRYDATKIGMKKCDLVVHDIYQMNPYANITAFSNGITEDNIDDFLCKDGKLDVLVEEVDNLEMKIRLRVAAKKHGIPVIMATDNGDNVIVDIERYDLDKNLKIFNGVVGDLTIDQFKNFPPQELPKLAAKIVGPELITKRMMMSLSEVGKTLYSWPQLGDAATMCGVVISYLVKKLALGEQIKSGKLEVNLDSIFDLKI